MRPPPARFTATARFLHWVMAVMILAMLLLGLRMAATESAFYGTFVAIHRPLGIAVLLLVVVRLGWRLTHPAPPLPADLPALQKLAAHGSHVALYGLMFAMPLVGWGMLSAARYPVLLFGAITLPPILPRSLMLYATLREAHTVLALLLIALFLAHLGAALFHLLVRRDGVFETMAGRPATPRTAPLGSRPPT